MTDNLSSQTYQRLFGANAPPVLNAKYERLPEIKKQITECLALSETDFSARLAINNREADEFLREETLICLLTLAHSEKLAQIENSIATKLYRSCEKRIAKVLRKDSFDVNFIEEAVGDIYCVMLKQIFERTEESYDFWEARFYKALNALISAHRRKHREIYRTTELFTELSNEGETDYEHNLADDENFSARQERMLASREVLAEMPKNLRQIAVFYYRDEETQETIAEFFGITARTVRTKLRDIEKFFDVFRRRPQGDLK